MALDKRRVSTYFALPRLRLLSATRSFCRHVQLNVCRCPRWEPGNDLYLAAGRASRPPLSAVSEFTPPSHERRRGPLYPPPGDTGARIGL